MQLPTRLDDLGGVNLDRDIAAEFARLQERRERSGARRRKVAELFADYRPHAKQVNLHRSGARYVCAVAGRRGGKTYATAREFVRRIVLDLANEHRAGRHWRHRGRIKRQTPPLLHYWAIAPTYDLGLVQQRELASFLLGSGAVLHWADNRLWLVGGCLIEFRSADHPERLVGAGLSGVWLDEAARIKAGTWDDNVQPALGEREGWALFSSTPLGKNWLWHDIWAQRLDDGSPLADCYTWSSVDNTTQPALVAAAEQARQTLSRAIYLRNYEASWDAFEGQVYEELDESAHKVAPSEIPPPYHFDQVCSAGQDWGYSNKAAQICVGTHRGVWYVWREDVAKRLAVVRPGPGDSWVRRALANRERGVRRFWCDPASPESIDHFADAGLDASPAANSVMDGIETIAALLHHDPTVGGPRLRILADCPELWDALVAYHYPRDRHGQFTERPEKVDDHEPDALRYVVHTEELQAHTHAGLTQLRALDIRRR